MVIGSLLLMGAMNIQITMYAEDAVFFAIQYGNKVRKEGAKEYPMFSCNDP